MTDARGRPMARLSGLGLALAILMVGALAFHVPGADTVGSPTRANGFVAVLALGVGLYLAAVRLVLGTVLPRPALWVVIGIALAMRIALLPSLPFLSSDIYRYVWDGQVQAAGINPYLHLPVDPVLAHLRDPAVFPLINRATYAHTIYPPTAQAVFALVGQMSASVTGMKVAMLAFEGLAVVCLLPLLSLAGLPRERVLIYAWNPLVLWSFACDGHVDAVAIGLLALALLLRARHRDGLAGAILAGAVLVKFLPVVVVPAFIRGRGLRQTVLAGAAGAAVVMLLYLPYLSAGKALFGFLGAYGNEEGYDTGAGFWLVAGLSHLVPLPASAGRTYALGIAVGFGALALWILRRSPSETVPDVVTLCRDTAILAAVATAAANPHYAWYYAWLAVPATVAPIPAVVWLSAAPVLFLVDPFNERFFWPALVFVPALALAIRSALRGGAPAPIPGHALEGTA